MRPSPSWRRSLVARPEDPLSGRPGGPAAPGDGRRLVLASLAVLLASADTYVVVLALPNIMGGVGLGLDRLQEAAPIISGFLLGYTVMLPLVGRLSDNHGRLPVLTACLVVFATGSALTASAHGLGQVVAGRAVQGLGGGGLVPVTLAMVADRWPPDRRGVPLGLVGAVQELGAVIGPLYGAVVVGLAGWRAIFWVNLPAAGLLALVLVPRSGRRGRAGIGGFLLVLAGAPGLLLLAAPPVLTDSVAWGGWYVPLVGGTPWASLSSPLALAALGLAGAGAAWGLLRWGTGRLSSLGALGRAAREGDALGAVLMAGALACVIVVFATADPTQQVVGGHAVVLGPLGVVLAGLFVGQERRAAHPLVDLAAFGRVGPVGALVVSLASGAALMAALVDVPLFARVTAFPDSQLGAALVLVRYLVAVPIGALAGGWLVRRLPERWVAATGLVLSATMFWEMAAWGATALSGPLGIGGLRVPVRASDIVLALCGLGFGLVLAPVNSLVLRAVPPTLHGVASALVVVARTVGML